MSGKLTKKELERFRRALLGILDRIRVTTERIEAEALVAGEGAPGMQGDEGADQEFEEIDLDALDIEDATAQAVRDALERIEDGSYGRCTECDAWIAHARLEVLPYTPHCIACQEAEEAESS